MVTGPELARRLGVDPKRLRAWLRDQAATGHPLLTAHEPNGRWEFSNADAEQLARAYRSDPHTKRVAPATPTPSLPMRPASRAPRSDDPGHRVTTEWMGERVETLEDLLRPGLLAVIVGINPAPVSVAAGHYYQGRAGQALYRRLREVGMMDDGEGFEDDRAFAAGIGFTDVVKRPTASAGEVGDDELAHGGELLAAALTSFRPKLLIFAFKTAALTLMGPFQGFGFIDREFAGADVFVMPRPWEKAELAQPELDALAARFIRPA